MCPLNYNLHTYMFQSVFLKQKCQTMWMIFFVIYGSKPNLNVIFVYLCLYIVVLVVAHSREHKAEKVSTASWPFFFLLHTCFIVYV